MKEDTKGRPKKRKRLKSVKEPDAGQWLEEQFERIMRCYREMKAK